jgi:hypothetical protein
VFLNFYTLPFSPQDIINHYKLQQGTKVSKREELEEPTFTNTVPEAV